MTYRWARDEADVTFKVLIDGQWRTLLAGTQKEANVYRDSNGEIIARAVPGAGQRLTLVADVGALDRAAADMRAGASDDGASGSNTDTGSGLDQIYVDPSTGRTLVVPAGTDAATLPPGFVPMGIGSDPEPTGNSTGNSSAPTPAWQPPTEAVAKIPPSWGPPLVNRKKDTGYRWSDPSGSTANGIRIDQGNPTSQFSSQRVDHSRSIQWLSPRKRRRADIWKHKEQSDQRAHSPFGLAAMEILEYAMNSIKYPSLRANIDAAIEALADPELQRRAWIGRQAAPVGECPSFDDAVHWLFDDSGINNGAKASVGELFYDDREAQSVDFVMSQIDRMLDKYGSTMSDEQYINTAEWPDIVAAAAQCLQLLRENDRKYQGNPSS